jgi:Na+/proline symporter
MTAGCIGIGVIAMQQVSPELLDAHIPEGWRSLAFGWTLGLDWSGIMASANQKIEQDGWTLFSVFWMLMLFKGYLQSAAGPAPNYDMQRILSARTPRDAARMSALVNVVLLIPRYMLITGMTVLALVYFSDDLNAMGAAVDFERILPFTLRAFVPTGLLGVLIAALLAAYMGTYAATVNAAPAYLVNDLYKRYINPQADEKRLVQMSYGVSVAVVVIGTGVGLVVASLNDIVQWIVAALYGGYTASNLLKWYWWRFNSYGYFWGMVAGIGAAMVVPFLLPDLTELYSFPLILALSLFGCIAGSLLTPPDEEAVLKQFYLRVRPWGFWGPIRAQVLAEHPGATANKHFGRDMGNVVVGLVWQTALTATGIYLVLEMYLQLFICLVLILATSAYLKVFWYDRLQEWPDGVPVVPTPASSARAVSSSHA